MEKNTYEYLHDLYCSPNIFRVIKSKRVSWAGRVISMGKRKDVYMILVGKSEVKRPFGRPRRRLEDNLKMTLQEVRCGDMDLIELAL